MVRRRRRSSTSQRIAGIAAMAMPLPVRAVVRTRIGSWLFLFVFPALLMTGILTVEWKDGRPQLRFNRDRAQEVRREIREEIQNETGGGPGLQVPPFLQNGQFPQIGQEQWQTPQWQPPQPQQPSRFGFPGTTVPSQQQESEFRPMARIRDAFETQR